MKILNLYAGIGGNRKLWGNEHEITAVELNTEIAAVYQSFYPKDTVIVGDAHQYLLEHFKEFDFIWSSPPCPSHSRTNSFLNAKGVNRYPDMTLYQEIILLSKFYKGKYAIENVIPYYTPLIEPSVTLNRHHVWSNFQITKKRFGHSRSLRIAFESVSSLSEAYGINLPANVKDKRKLLRNVALPEMGLHILNEAIYE